MGCNQGGSELTTPPRVAAVVTQLASGVTTAAPFKADYA